MKLSVLIILGYVAILGKSNDLLKEFALANDQFSGKVYQKLAKLNSGSFSVCPLSVDVLLALFHAGAKGETARQISEILHLTNNHEDIQKTFSALSSQLKSTENYELSSANKVYIRQGFQINQQFKDIATSVFNSEIQNIDFTKSKAAAEEMNKWVEEKTHNKIKELVSENDLKENPATVLINAMYFHGKWQKQFHSRATKERRFHVNNQKTVNVDMMEMADSFKSYESSDLNAKFLVMPYEGEDITMTFVLPNDVEGLPALESRIQEVLNTSFNYHGRVHLVIPKFKIETTIQFKPILVSLGVTVPFSNNADFSEINTQLPLTISKIIQKTFLEVEEEGTTAAAGTAGFITPLSSSYVPPPVMQFIADHPFLYFIKIRDIVFFVGRYNGL